MKTYTQYELKNAVFEIEQYGEADVAKLSPADLLLLAETAESQWAYRRGARKESDGKRYSLLDMIADIRATGTTRPGKITAKDIEAAESAFKRLLKFAEESVPAEGYTPSELADARDISIWENFEDHVESVEKKHAFAPERPEELTVDTLKAFLPSWCRSLRLAIDRQAATEKKKGLFS